MAVERVYNVPLRKEWLKAPKYRRAKKAVKALKQFLVHHMKADEGSILLGRNLNEKLWEHGIKNPPHHVKVDVAKEDDGKVYAELQGFKYEKPVKEEPKKTLMDKLRGKKEDKKASEKIEDKGGESPEKKVADNADKSEKVNSKEEKETTVESPKADEQVQKTEKNIE